MNRPVDKEKRVRSSRRYGVWLSLVTILIAMLAPSPSHATDLRGQVRVHVAHPPGWVARPYANVVLFTVTQQNQLQQFGIFATGQDGMYYFYGLAPGAAVRVQVNGGPYEDVAVPNLPFVDVRAIFLPR